ncbi:MAG: GIY-YIG nuclease family protein [Clostridia bacterium]|nr:GIY-YIG nuclease family protein [Clostridia bacterium]
MYYVYMLRCEDNSIYTGITVDIERRLKEHKEKDEKCAKYTASHAVKKLESVWKTENKSLASKLEYNIKKSLTKRQKEELIQKNNLEELFREKIDYTKYEKIE